MVHEELLWDPGGEGTRDDGLGTCEAASPGKRRYVIQALPKGTRDGLSNGVALAAV